MAKCILVATTVALSWLVVNGTAAQAPTPASPQPQPSTQASPQTPTGDAKRGKTLFERTYRCYACHGFDGQTGTVRLVPMTRSRDAFVAFVRNPPRDAMPRYADVPERDLSDVHAYIRSIVPSKAPSNEIPLLKELLERIKKN